MRISPREFLRTRRPEQFSDSVVVSVRKIDRLKLEYYLGTLSSRSQELEFEHFAKRLCELEICPNLLPHTGPTGGGDSKADSETYPVADKLSLIWYTGIGREAAQERWAFAFSIKQKWADKVRSDVKKIAEARRGYTVAYFVSSQFIPDKKRAEVEDALTNAHGLDVRILDRSWLLNVVFGKGHEEVVEQELHVELPDIPRPKIGPLDLKRDEDLQTLDVRVKEDASRDEVSFPTVNAAIQSAILSRELERSREQTDGRFERAVRLATQYGTLHQQIEATYQYAWTTYWWHEDFDTFLNLYDHLQRLVITSDNVFHAERLFNLWCNLLTIQSNKESPFEDEVFKQRTQTLEIHLEQLASDDDKPSASLYAETLRLQVTLLRAKFSGADPNQPLERLAQVIQGSRNLVGFPFKPLVEALTETSEFWEDVPKYQELFDTILEVVQERDGEVASARLRLDRGEKQLVMRKPYEAIQTFGLALRDLFKHESRRDAVRALYLLGNAYREVDLLWAARGSLLTAASLATSEFWVYGKINAMQAACYGHLKWLELCLGRIPQALDWHGLDFAVREMLVRDGYDTDRLFDPLNQFDVALGVLVLHADLATLDTLRRLPDVLPPLGLECAPTAIYYSLGCEEHLPPEFDASIPDRKEFFEQWFAQYDPQVLPSHISSSEGPTIQLASSILGCQITVNVLNEEPFIEVAESLLAILEGFAATSIIRRAMAIEPVAVVNVIESTSSEAMIHFTPVKDLDMFSVTVLSKRFDPHTVTPADLTNLREALFEIVTHVVAHILTFADMKEQLEDLIGRERALERALNYGTSFVTLGNVLGHHPKLRIRDWVTPSCTEYPLKRHQPFAEVVWSEPPEIRPQAALSRPDPFRAKHSEIQTASIIRPTLWEVAAWTGTGYIYVPDGKTPPVVAVLFKDKDAGRRIFAAWRKQLGRSDKEEMVRLVIVEGIDKHNIYHYRIGIGANVNIENGPDRAPRYYTVAMRIHTMTPSSDENITIFKEAYKLFGVYLLAPGHFDPDGSARVSFDHGILKREVHFKQAWEIGPHELDALLVSPEDEIVPRPNGTSAG